MKLTSVLRIADKASRIMVCPRCHHTWITRRIHRNVVNRPARCPKCNKKL